MTNEQPPAQKNLSKRALKGLGWTSLTTGLEYVINLVTMVVLARLLLPKEFGLVSLAASFIAFAALFSTIGMGPALIRKANITAAHINVAYTSVMALGLAASLLLVASSHWLAEFFRTPDLEVMLWLVAILIPIRAASSISVALLRRQGEFRFITLSDFPAHLFGYFFLSILLAVLGFGAWAPVIGTFAQITISSVLRFIRAKHSLSFSWNHAAFHELLHFSLSQTVTQWFGYWSNNSDNFTVARMLGPEALGLYGRAYRLIMIPVELVSGGALGVLYPLLSGVQDDLPRLKRAYCRGIMVLIDVLAPMSVIMIFIARPLVLLLLGPKWQEAVEPVQILFAFLIFRASYRYLNVINYLKGWTYTVAVTTGFYAALVFVAAIVGAKFGTISAVALAVGIAQCIYYVVSAAVANRQLSVSWLTFASLHMPGAATAAVIGVGLALVSIAPWLGNSSIMDLATYLSVTIGLLLVLYIGQPRLFLGADTLSIFAKLARPLPFAGPHIARRFKAQSTGNEI